MPKFFKRLSIIKPLLMLWFVFQCPYVSAQNFSGLTLDVEGGIYSTWLNPAFSTEYPYSWHANVLSTGLSFYSDYAYVSNSSLIDFTRNFNAIDIAGKSTDINTNLRQLVFDQNGGRKNGSIVSTLAWPAYMWKSSRDETMGVYMKTNLVGSFIDLPEVLGYYEVSSIVDNPTQIGDINAGYMVWTDLGFHYSKYISRSSYEKSSLGINARLVLPHEASSIVTETEVIYNRVDTLFTADGLAYSSQYTFFDDESGIARFNGIGLGLDIGYQITNETYSLGFSFMDFGFAAYSSNAENYKLVADSVLFYTSANVVDHEDIIEIIEDVDEQLEPQVNRFIENTSSFTLALPTFFSIQYHRPISDTWTLSLIMSQRVPLSKGMIRRPNSFVAVPRYKSGWLNIAFPLSLYDYQDPRIGFSIMYWGFFVGSDDLSSLFFNHDFNGSDLYFGFQIYPFDKAKKKKGVECFKF